MRHEGGVRRRQAPGADDPCVSLQGWKLHQEGLQSASVDFENPADLKV